VARDRSNEIRAIISSKRRAFLATQVGRTLPAITLDETEGGARVALTTNYLQVSLRDSDLPANRLVDVHVDGLGSRGLLGRTQAGAFRGSDVHLEVPA
jgi:tRNA A37 methylthiotransferase MiaB